MMSVTTAPAALPAAAPPTRGLTPEECRAFRRDGFVVIEEFADPATCAALRRDLGAHFERGHSIDVQLKASRFRTFNGADVDANFPTLAAIYDRSLLEAVQALMGPLATLTDRGVGLSVNLTPAGGKFQPHFDRNALTAVLYVNDDFEGGLMHLYPRIRFLLPGLTTAFAHHVQRILDGCVRQPFYRRFIARQVQVQPAAGKLLVFEGNRCLHAVGPVTAGSSRISIQFAYDRPGKTYDTRDYYGNKP